MQATGETDSTDAVPGPEKGSEFRLHVPLHARSLAQASAAVQPSAELATESPGRRVLVVDDNRDAGVSLAEVLRLFGHEVELAEDGPSALALTETSPPFDVAFLDIGLPGMSGYELAQALRQRPAGRAPRLVALTGYGAASDMDKSHRSGFDEHLVKPVEIDVLLASIARAGGADRS